MAKTGEIERTHSREDSRARTPGGCLSLKHGEEVGGYIKEIIILDNGAPAGGTLTREDCNNSLPTCPAWRNVGDCMAEFAHTIPGLTDKRTRCGKVYKYIQGTSPQSEPQTE